VICAAIDVGSNSIRMLLQGPDGSVLAEPRYFREVTRLAGDFHPETGLAPGSMTRALDVLVHFAGLLRHYRVEKVRAVGTAALRQAVNAGEFIENVRRQTGLTIEIIDGDREAALSCRGILSVLDPLPKRALLFDIGGGSTEIILLDEGEICLQQSFPLGVVRLIEDYPEPGQCLQPIRQELIPFFENSTWKSWQQDAAPVELVGTAGTVTTLAALKLRMVEYDSRRVNNLVLERDWLEAMCRQLTGLSLNERAALPGMEEGRTDVIIPGLQIVNFLLASAGSDALRVADAGLLEGLLLPASI